MAGIGRSMSRPGMFGNKAVNQSHPSWLWSVIQQGRAAGEGALDTLTFGLDDQAAAGARAAVDWAHGQRLVDAYRRRIADQHRNDAYDAAHFGTGRTLGTVGATAAGLLLPGGALGVVAKGLGGGARALKVGGRIARLANNLEKRGRLAARISQATPFNGRENIAVAGAGAATGIGTRAVSDLVTGKMSSWHDYAGDAVGSAAEALAALKGRPTLAAGLGGATTSVTQDALDGKLPSISDAAQSAYGSALLASAAHRMPSNAVARLTTKQKERLGEFGSKVRTRVRGDRTISTKKERYALAKSDGFTAGYTYPDQRTASGQLIESKFGNSASLSRRQTQAFHQLGPQYRVDHLLPRDIGSAAAFLASQAGHDLGRGEVDYADPELWPARFPPR